MKTTWTHDELKVALMAADQKWGDWPEHKSEGNSLPKCDRCDEMRACFEVLYGTLVTFNERKQEFFCTVCRYRDPLGPDGNKLHDDACPVLEMAKACEVKP
jgi:hypothetical protein